MHSSNCYAAVVNFFYGWHNHLEYLNWSFLCTFESRKHVKDFVFLFIHVKKVKAWRPRRDMFSDRKFED